MKREKRRMARSASLARTIPPAVNTADEPRPALAVFCWEHPETPIGQSVLQSVAALRGGEPPSIYSPALLPS